MRGLIASSKARTRSTASSRRRCWPNGSARDVSSRPAASRTAAALGRNDAAAIVASLRAVTMLVVGAALDAEDAPLDRDQPVAMRACDMLLETFAASSAAARAAQSVGADPSRASLHADLALVAAADAADRVRRHARTAMAASDVRRRAEHRDGRDRSRARWRAGQHDCRPGAHRRCRGRARRLSRRIVRERTMTRRSPGRLRHGLTMAAAGWLCARGRVHVGPAAARKHGRLRKDNSTTSVSRQGRVPADRSAVAGRPGRARHIRAAALLPGGPVAAHPGGAR